ncbi:MAG: hypothetical protein ACP5NV_03750 [Candidatus Woesearchaeota archaeon]
MRRDIANWITKTHLGVALIIVLAIFSTIVSLSTYDVVAAPSGPIIVTNSTLNYTPQVAAQITTPGGSFTTIVLNATTQTPRWKAYVGNVTGKLALDDSTQKSIFDWSLSSVTGEVYATRNSSIDWASIGCANTASIINEESSLNMSSTNADTINKTFAYTSHRAFYVGTVAIQNSTCRSLATYINDSAQAVDENAKFQEMLLMDSNSRIVYTTLINQNTSGFNNQKYDFQMIVPENEFGLNPTTYYLYVELI